MKRGLLIAFSLVVVLSPDAWASDRYALKQLKQIDKTYETYKLSNRPIPDDIQVFSLSVSGRVAEILEKVKGDIDNAYHKSAGYSYIKSAASPEDYREISRAIKSGISSLLSQNTKLNEKSPWRIIVEYRGYPSSHIVSSGGGPYVPIFAFVVNAFLVNDDNKELFYYKGLNINTDNTEKAVKMATDFVAFDFGKVLKTKPSRK